MKKLRIVDKKIGQAPEVAEMVHTIEAMQERVGGLFDCISLPENIDMWVDDEGLLKERPLNLIIVVNGEEVCHVVGDVFFTSHDNQGNTKSLSDKQIEWIENHLIPYKIEVNKKTSDMTVIGGIIINI